MTFTPLPGAIDFSAQVSESLQLLGQYALNVPVGGPGGQVVDITSVLYPNLQGLLLVYVPVFPSSLSPLVVQLLAGSPDAQFGYTVMAPQAEWAVPMPSGIVTSVVGASALLNLGTGPGVVANITGTLFVFGVMSNPLSISVARRPFIGTGSSTSTVTVNAGATVTVLAAPSLGQYYRIKAFLFGHSAGPAAGNAVSFQSISTLKILWRAHVPTTANFDAQLVTDWECDEGIQCINSLTVATAASILYETWPA